MVVRADEGYAAPQYDACVSHVNFASGAGKYSLTVEKTWATEAKEDVCLISKQENSTASNQNRSDILRVINQSANITSLAPASPSV